LLVHVSATAATSSAISIVLAAEDTADGKTDETHDDNL
jgi:hypothetical protein